MAEIRVENLQQGFGDFVAVQDSTFTVEDGEFFCLLGPSGCGKTTTLRMIAGLELPTSGAILLGGEDVTFKRAARARHRLRLPALRALSAHERAEEHRLPAACQGMPRRRDPQRASRRRRGSCASTICSTSRSRGLAGGDRQRVALGRAIVRRPKAFLMDEPLGTLDAEFRDLMVRELRELHDRIGATTVYVTHDQLEAMAMADKIAVMNHGVIEQFGTPQEIYDRPATMFVADFIGSPPMNFLPSAARSRPGATAVALDGAEVAVPAIARGSAPSATSPSASARSTSASTTPARLRGDGLRRRISRHDPDRHGRHRSTARSRRGCRPTSRCSPASRSASRFRAERLSLFDKATRPRDPHRRCTRERRHG